MRQVAVASLCFLMLGCGSSSEVAETNTTLAQEGPRATRTDATPARASDSPALTDDAAESAAHLQARFCEPLVYCGCWSPCEWIAPAERGLFRRTERPDERALLSRGLGCEPGEEDCSEYCEGGECRGALAPLPPQPCTGACRPTRAPFECRVVGDVCSGGEQDGQ